MLQQGDVECPGHGLTEGAAGVKLTNNLSTVGHGTIQGIKYQEFTNLFYHIKDVNFCHAHSSNHVRITQQSVANQDEGFLIM